MVAPDDYYCDHFGKSFYDAGNQLSSTQNASYVRIDETIASSAAALKTWFTANPTTCYYILVSPTDTKITDINLINELSALNTAKSYLDTTHFLTTATGANLPIILDLEAYTKSLNGILGYIGDNS